ncbi:hypothetical protein GQ56_0127450 [Burkholderia paludis]|uniref:GNAT family N-acetyltransferase n=1 Tax=Burkholderia paludis TaxID=1506587 RepID=UPI0004DB5E80|nr:GNAT family protein [Burkholderia paludis]KFG94243.1 hypothetical protein GQ56_0127450 [Burkholderia paludis]
MLEIRHPTLDDAVPLLQFEVDNRAWFERWVQARDDSYYSIESVRNAIAAATSDARNDRAYQHLLKQDGVIVGRVNLTGVVRPYFSKASLGYRIGERYAGLGYASQAVRLVLRTALVDLDLWRIEAQVRVDNQASSRVLERNGFATYGISRRSMRLHGTWHDQIHYERHLDGATI